MSRSRVTILSDLPTIRGGDCTRGLTIHESVATVLAGMMVTPFVVYVVIPDSEVNRRHLYGIPMATLIMMA